VKDNRFTIRLEDDLVKKIEADARKEHSDISTVIWNILYTHYDHPANDTTTLKETNKLLEKIVRLLSAKEDAEIRREGF
jgi:hypothetical protein